MKISNYFCLIALTVCACAEKEVVKTNELITIDTEKYKTGLEITSNNVDSIEVVRLETNDECLISAVCNVIRSKDRIFIIDTDENESLIKIFDNKGKYINSIKRGNGPEEVVYAVNYFFDEKNEQFIILVDKEIKFFNKNGKLCNTKLIPFSCMKFANLYDEYQFAEPFKTNDSIDYKFIVTDTCFNVKNMAIKYNESDNSSLYISFNDIFNIFENELKIIFMYDDTIYSYDSKNIRPQYYFKYSDKLNMESAIDDNGVFIIDTNNFKGLNMGGFFENQYNIFFNMSRMSESKIVNYVFDKETQTLYGEIEVKTALVDLPAMRANSRGLYVTNFSFEKYQEKLNSKLQIPEKVKNELETLTEEDNPILVFYKLKRIYE